MAWATPSTTPEDRLRVLGPGAWRVHAIEYGWLEAMRETTVYAYRMPKALFRTVSLTETHAWVATVPVTPLAPAEPIGDLLELHRAAGIQLRVVDTLWPWWDAVVASSVAFSGIRLRNGIGYPYG
jgi:hypothetical protein